MRVCFCVFNFLSATDSPSARQKKRTRIQGADGKSTSQVLSSDNCSALPGGLLLHVLLYIQWRVDAVVSWAVARDLAGPSKVLHENAVNGQDLLDADEGLMVKDLRLTPFAARKLLRARDAFLRGC